MKVIYQVTLKWIIVNCIYMVNWMIFLQNINFQHVCISNLIWFENIVTPKN
jgi:hypothetical protein